MWTGDMQNGYPTQWALNPSAYQNMPNESVDWATLAQQWIQMKETFPVDQVPPAPPPPSIKGEVPTTGSDEAILAANASSNSQDGMQWGGWQQQWDWSSNSGYVAPATFEYNHGATTAVPVTENFDQGYWSGSQMPAPHVREGRSTEWRAMDVSRPQPGRRPQAPHPEEVVEFQPDTVAMIDAAKRKQLPAWIREGLEKMEREKQKKLERERQLKEREEEMLKKKQEEEEALASGIPAKSKFETDSEDSGKEEENPPQEDETSKKPRRSRFDTGPISPAPAPQPAAAIQSSTLSTPLPMPVKRKTREEIMQEVMHQVKYMLTDILMTVTNEEMKKIAEETLADFRAKAPVAQLRKTQAFTSLTGKLGLGIYDSEESSEESEPEPDKSNGIDSDEELRERIIRKKQEFARIERDIENEVEKQEEREREREQFEREAEAEVETETAAQVQLKLSPPGLKQEVKMEESKITLALKPGPEVESYTPERVQTHKKERSSSEERTEESDKSSSSSDTSSSSSSDSKYRKSKRSRKKKERRHSEKKRKRSVSRGSERRRTSVTSGSRRHRSPSRSRSREYHRRKRSRSRESHNSHSHSYSHRHSHKRKHRSRSYSRSRSPDYRYHYSRGKKSSHRSRD